MTPVGFIGVGNMGLPLADRLIDAGQGLMVYDARNAAVEPLLQRQARRAETVLDIADNCNVAIISLPTLESIRSVVLGDQGLISGKKLRTIINTSTIGVPLTNELADALATQRIELVDCPVSGGPGGARSGSLSVMVSGSPTAIDSVRHLISQWV